jgi:hypothetical protein
MQKTTLAIVFLLALIPCLLVIGLLTTPRFSPGVTQANSKLLHLGMSLEQVEAIRRADPVR